MNNDLLTAPDVPQNNVPDLAKIEGTNALLALLVRETRKSHPSQRCVCVFDYSNPQKILDSGADTCEVKFLSSGKPVRSQYLTISNNTGEILNVGLNEPVSLNGAGTFATGVKIPAGGTFQIPVEIEKVQLRLVANASGKGIVVNNTPAGIPTNGVVQVYAWTIPNSDKDETE